MRLRASDPWRWDGVIDRGPYVTWGLLLFALKYNIDRVVVGAMTGEMWYPWSYLIGGDALKPITSVNDPALYALLIALALPFIWAGVALTTRRIRSLGWPLWGVVFFFIPVVNLLLFMFLALVPARNPDEETGSDPGFLGRVIPRSQIGSAFLAVVVTVVFTTALAAWSTLFLESYGWGLFVGLPFGLGLFSALIYNYHEERSFAASVGVAFLSCALVGLLIFAIAVEGAICILMAAPIALILAFFGAAIGYAIQHGPRPRVRKPPAFFVLLIGLPFLLGAETAVAPEPDLIEVATVVDIDAPPERVWPFVVAFAELPPPTEAFFRAGVAYPIRAEIFGEGPGAIRHCTFSTGAFVEPIEAWDAPRRLKFGVTSQPPAMRELSPWPGIQPAHVNDFLVTRAGEFLLEPLPGGRTRLTGTTWYSHRMWPAFYWRLWSDGIIHAIHGRVMEHIKKRAESP